MFLLISLIVADIYQHLSDYTDETIPLSLFNYTFLQLKKMRMSYLHEIIFPALEPLLIFT